MTHHDAWEIAQQLKQIAMGVGFLIGLGLVTFGVWRWQR